MDISRGRARRFSRRPEARPEELLEAAVAVFGERGYRATTLDDVARRAGVSKGTVYLYFTSKDDLFRAMVEAKVVSLLESTEAEVREHTGSATKLLEAVIRRMWAKLSRNDMVCMTRLVQAELPQFPEIQQFYFENVIQRHRRLLRTIVERGVAAGEFRADAVQMVPTMVPALVLHLNQSRWLFGALDPDQPAPDAQLQALLSFVFDGIRARPAVPQPPKD